MPKKFEVENGCFTYTLWDMALILK